VLVPGSRTSFAILFIAACLPANIQKVVEEAGGSGPLPPGDDFLADRDLLAEAFSRKSSRNALPWKPLRCS
jgi:hypothetical protein